jgi:hypothetical protein
LFNQARFAGIFLDHDGTVTSRLAEPYERLLGPTLPTQLGKPVRPKKYGPAKGGAVRSNVQVLVGVTGLEPVASTVSR